MWYAASMSLQRASWTTLGAYMLLLVFTTPACGDGNGGTNEPSQRQRKNAESCQSMKNALDAQGCATAYTTFRCEIYEDASGDCVPWFQCLKDAACDVEAQRKCQEVQGSCGNPG